MQTRVYKTNRGAQDLRRSETAMDGKTKPRRDGQLKLWGM